MLWLGRSAGGRWKCDGDPLCIWEDARVAGLAISALKVGGAYCLLSFKSNVIRDCALENNSRWFSKWFLDVKPWVKRLFCIFIDLN